MKGEGIRELQWGGGGTRRVERQPARRVWALGQGGERLSPQGALHLGGGARSFGLKPLERLVGCVGGDSGDIQVYNGVSPRPCITRNSGAAPPFCPLSYPSPLFSP